MRRRLQWIALTTLGLAGGLTIGLALGGPIGGVVGMILVTPVTMLLAGSLLGTAQWISLPRRLVSLRRWIPASAVGLGIGFTAGIVAVEFLGEWLTGAPVRFRTLGPLGRASGLVVVGLIAGLSLGVAQALALRHEASPRRWVLTTMAGIGIGLPAGGLVADAVFGGVATAVGFGTFLVVAGAVSGAITATAASRLSAASGVT